MAYTVVGKKNKEVSKRYTVVDKVNKQVLRRYRAMGGVLKLVWEAITGIKYIMTGIAYHYESSSGTTYKYLHPRNEDGSLGSTKDIISIDVNCDMANLCKSGEYAWNANTYFYGYPYTWDEVKSIYVQGTYINFNNLLATAFGDKYTSVSHASHCVSADGKSALVCYKFGYTSGNYVYGGAGVALFKLDNGVVSFVEDIGEVYSWYYYKSSWFDVYYETTYPTPGVEFQASDDLSKFYVATALYNDFTNGSYIYNKYVYARQSSGTYAQILAKSGVAHGYDFLTSDGKFFLLRTSTSSSATYPWTIYYLTDTTATSLSALGLSTYNTPNEQRYNPQLQIYYYRLGGYIYQFVLSETGVTTLGRNYFSPAESIKDETYNGVYVLTTTANSDDSSLQDLNYKKTSRATSGLITTFSTVSTLKSGVVYKAMKFIDPETDIQ